MDKIWVLAPRDQRTGQNSGGGSGRLRIIAGLLLLVFFFTIAMPVQAQSGTPTPGGGDPSQAPDRVEIEPTARDEQIRERLVSILEATGWFVNPEVDVREGVVFLTGQAQTSDYKDWAGNLARNTQDVVAVVNQMQLPAPSIWDIQPAIDELRNLWTNLIRSTPLVTVSLLVLLITWIITRFAVRAARASLNRRLTNPLLTNVAGYVVGVMTFLIGLYIVLQIAGLTNVAMTVIGGTGLLGLILGIAFRDITENFLASIFLSVQNPFRTGDLIEVAGIQGFVQALTTRATILMTLDGNHVQIPNATVYKSNISNFTSNPVRRADFIIGIGYDESITEAQDLALKILAEHPAVLKEPEPLILVENLGSAKVNIRIYFWIDGKEHSWAKVKSSVIRLSIHAFQEAGISMPDEAREMIFPQGIPIQIIQEGDRLKGIPAPPAHTEHAAPAESDSISTTAEAGLSSEAKMLQEQAEKGWQPGEGENLLKDE